jgi:site-specific DNA recombinase
MKAIGIVRVSRIGDREDGDRFQSPAVQRERLADLCRRENLELIATLEELDVSGRKPLAGRRKLTAAIEAVEAGRASVLVVAYFDRLVRSVRVQQEVVDRVEAAGGKVLTADLGQVSNGTAIKRLSGTLLGAINEYVAETARERSIEGTDEAIAQGKVPGRLIAGLRRTDTSVELDPETAEPVREAFRLRAEGKSVREVRVHLAEHGIRRSHHAVSRMLSNEQAVGVLKFGQHRIAVPRLIDDDLFQRARRASAPPGRKGKSDRLLARLGVLRCGTCGSRMVVSPADRGRYWTYRCPPTGGDCARRMSISAETAEQVTAAATRTMLDGTIGVRAVRDRARQVRDAYQRTQDTLDALIDLLDPLEPAAKKRLTEATAARNQARRLMEETGVVAGDLTLLMLDDDWNRLTVEDQRRCIRAVIKDVKVMPNGPGTRPEDRLVVTYHDGLDRLAGRTPRLPSELS